MATRDFRWTLILVVAALLLGFAAQALWGRGEQALLQGLVLWGLALGAYLWAASRMDRPSLWLGYGLRTQLWELLGRSWLRLALLCASLAGSLLVGGASLRRDPRAARWDLLVCWVVMALVALAAVVDWRALPDRLARLLGSLRRPTPETMAVALLALVAGMLRFWSLETIPSVLSGDEASMGLEAASVLAGTLTNPFATGWLSHPTLYFFLQAPFVRYLGHTVAALRISSALISTATVPLLYLFARRQFGRRTGLLAAIFLVGYHFAIHFGRLGMNNTWDPALALGALYCTDRGLEEHHPAWALVGGLFTGMGAYFYMGARLVPIMVGAYVLLAARGRADYWRSAIPLLVLWGLGATVVATPLLMFWRAHPADMMARWKMLAIGPSGWLAEEAARRGVSQTTVFLGQLKKAVLGWVLYTDPTFHYRATIPLLGLGSAVFFVFGLVVAARRWRHAGVALLLIWVALVVLLGGALLENPPSSPRYVIAIPAVAMLVALGMDDICYRIGALSGLPAPASGALAALLALGLAGASARYYLQTYTSAGIYGGPNTHVAYGVARHLQMLPAPTTCYMLGAPRIYYGFATIPYLNPDVQGADVLEPLRSMADVPIASGNTVFVLLPERLPELDAIQARYPEGTLLRHHDAKGQLLFVSYLVEG